MKKHSARCSRCGAVHQLDAPLIICDNAVLWLKDGKLHRDNGPAVVYLDVGCLEWMIDGCLHRENDKPAIINRNGELSWWSNGERHRVHKPAYVGISRGNLLWYEYGESSNLLIR